MATLPKTAEPYNLNSDLAAAVMAGRVVDDLTGLPIPGDRKRARALAKTPCRRILAPRVAADGELDAIAGRLGDLRLRHHDAVTYETDDGASVLLVTAARPEVGGLTMAAYRRETGGVWSTDRVTVSYGRDGWSLDRSAPFLVETPADAEAVRTRLLDDAMDAAAVLLAHLADTRDAVDRFYEEATMEEFAQATLGCSIEEAAVRIFESGGRTTFRMTLPPV